MATGPSPRVRQEFRKYLTNTVASEGEPAALGKSATGPVYYTDYDGVIHKNRVWFRKGSNKEIVGVARADNQGLPDVPNLPIRVARRFGSNWVVDWQRENAAVPTGGGGGTATQAIYINALMFDDRFNATLTGYSGFWGPVWTMTGGSALKSVRTMIPCPYAADTVTVSAYFASVGNSGTHRFSVLVGGADPDEDISAGIHNMTTQVTADVDPTPDVSTNGVWATEVDLSSSGNAVSAGGLLAVEFQRLGSGSGDNNADAIYFAGLLIEFPDASTGGATSTASGVHKFSPAAMLAAQNASETSVNSLATPAIAIPDSGATPTINVSFLAEKTSATLDIDIYAVTASGSGNVVLDADAYSGATDGTGTPTDRNGFVTDGTFAADGNIRKFTLTVAFTTQPDLAPGNYCSLRIQRLVASGSDTLAADLHVLMIVVTENGDG